MVKKVREEIRRNRMIKKKLYHMDREGKGVVINGRTFDRPG